MNPRACRWLLNVAAMLVPAKERAGWRRHRDGEIWFRTRELTLAGKSDGQIHAELVRHCWRMLPDAFWTRFDRQSVRDNAAGLVRHPWFCLSVLAAMVIAIAIGSRGIPRTLRAIQGPDYEEARSVIMIARQHPFLSRREPVNRSSIEQWRKRSKTVSEFGWYQFRKSWLTGASVHPQVFAHAVVSPNFFNVLGVEEGRGLTEGCTDCVVVSATLKERYPDRFRTDGTVEIDGEQRRVVGVLPDRFWLQIEQPMAFSLVRNSEPRRVMAIGRLSSGSEPDIAQDELREIVRRPTINVTGASDRMRYALVRYGRASAVVLGATLLVALLAILKQSRSGKYFAFFAAKATLSILAVQIFTLEYAGAGKLTMTGTNRMEFAPFTLYFWVVGTALLLWWVVRDQRRRCPTCLRRLFMPVRIGATDKVLFEQEGTELVCPGGHGTLYVQDATDSFREDGRWREFDESWQELFTTNDRR